MANTYSLNERAVERGWVGMGLIQARQSCHYRAAEWRHKEIELAAHELLQQLDAKSG
jgi:hypothetical protein